MTYYSNEIVFRGHPDKVCDQISGALLDAYLKDDPYTRAGIEVMGGKNYIYVTGEVTSSSKVDVEEVVRRVIKDVGYDCSSYKVINDIGLQSSDIAQGVDVGGAGDQGMMFGYACDDTPELLPTAMVILQKLARGYEELKKTNNHFKADGKAQITGVYDDDFKLVRIKDFTISYQNDGLDCENTDKEIKELSDSICREYGIEVETYHINPTGKFVIGGFEGDAGLTGRKIVVDAYQSFANVGGGCMNGKDPTKVDMSAAHKARQIACRLLESENLKWCEVQLSYAIGLAKPLAIHITSDKGTIDVEGKYEGLYNECEPRRIIEDLHMREPIYEELAKFGHFTKRDV